MLDVTDWRLVYNTSGASSRIKSLQIHATLAGQIDVPVYSTAPWGGVVAISLLPASFLRARSR